MIVDIFFRKWAQQFFFTGFKLFFKKQNETKRNKRIKLNSILTLKKKRELLFVVTKCHQIPDPGAIHCRARVFYIYIFIYQIGNSIFQSFSNLLLIDYFFGYCFFLFGFSFFPNPNYSSINQWHTHIYTCVCVIGESNRIYSNH